MKKSHRRGADRWREIISAQPASRLSIAAFCRDHGISQPSFFVWRRRLAGMAAQVKPSAAQVKPSAAPFAEVRVSASGAGSGGGIEIRVRGGRRLLLRRGFDRGLLTDVVQALEAMA